MPSLKIFVRVFLSVEVGHAAVELPQSRHLTWRFGTGPRVGHMRMSSKHSTLLAAESSG